MIEVERPQNFYPDPDGSNGGVLFLRPGSGGPIVTANQPEFRRSLTYDRRSGRLLSINFQNFGKADLRALPQDNVIPSEDRLVELFNSAGVSPKFDHDLVGVDTSPAAVLVDSRTPVLPRSFVPQPAF